MRSDEFSSESIRNIVRLSLIDLKASYGDDESVQTIKNLEIGLIDPILMPFVDISSYDEAGRVERRVVSLWVVYRDSKSKYMIVFDSLRGDYGLAEVYYGVARYIGVNGSILYVYDAM